MVCEAQAHARERRRVSLEVRKHSPIGRLVLCDTPGALRQKRLEGRCGPICRSVGVRQERWLPDDRRARGFMFSGSSGSPPSGGASRRRRRSATKLSGCTRHVAPGCDPGFWAHRLHHRPDQARDRGGQLMDPTGSLMALTLAPLDELAPGVGCSWGSARIGIRWRVLHGCISSPYHSRYESRTRTHSHPQLRLRLVDT